MNLQLLYKTDVGLAGGIVNNTIEEQIHTGMLVKQIKVDYKDRPLEDPVWAFIIPNCLKGKIIDQTEAVLHL